LTKPQGFILPLATPVLASGEIDTATLARLIEFEIGAGAEAIFANGSMGGFAFHTDEHQARLIGACVDIVAGRVPVYAGVSDTSVSRVLAKLERLAGLPLRAVVALPPFFFRYQPAELEAFFVAIASASSFPLLLYDNPKQVVNRLSVESIVRLAGHPNIHFASLPRERFGLICGAELKMAAGLEAGFDGITGGFHNVVPSLAASLMAAARVRDWNQAHRIQDEISRLYPAFVQDGGFRGLNQAMARLGIGGTYTPTFLHQEVPL